MEINRVDKEEKKECEASVSAERMQDVTPTRVSVSLGAELSEGYVIQTEGPVPKIEWMPFQLSSHGLEALQALSEHLAQQISEIFKRRNELPISISCDLYPKFPTTYAAELLSQAYDVPLYRLQKCHRALLDRIGTIDNEEEIFGLCLDTMSYGSDGTLWGGEILSLRGNGFTRLASIHPYFLMGSNMELHHPAPWQTAVAMLYDLSRMSHGEDEAIRDFVAKGATSEQVHRLDLCSLNDARAQYIAQDRNKNTTRSTAATGLVDAACAILGFWRTDSLTGKSTMKTLADAAEAFEKQTERKAENVAYVQMLHRKLAVWIQQAEEREDPTLETGDLWEDTDEGAFCEASRDESPDILHTEQLIRLLADERITYLEAHGHRNYPHPFEENTREQGQEDENNQLLSWFFFDALSSICAHYIHMHTMGPVYIAGALGTEKHFLQCLSKKIPVWNLGENARSGSSCEAPTWIK